MAYIPLSLSHTETVETIICYAEIHVEIYSVWGELPAKSASKRWFLQEILEKRKLRYRHWKTVELTVLMWTLAHNSIVLQQKIE